MARTRKVSLGKPGAKKIVRRLAKSVLEVSAKNAAAKNACAKEALSRKQLKAAKNATLGAFVKHPGEVLLNQFMKPLALSVNRLSRLLNVAPARISELLNGRRAITCETAFRLARFFGTTPRFWLDLQVDYELSKAEPKWSSIVAREIQPTGDSSAIDNSMIGGKKSAAQLKSTDRHSSVASKKNGLAPDAIKLAISKLTAPQKKIYKLLSEEEYVHFDILFYKTGMKAGELSAELTMLELSNVVERDTGDYYRKTAGSE